MEGTLRREGELWTAELGGRVARLRDSRGIQHLAVLLAQPGREVHALDLAGAPGGAGAGSGDAGPLLDDQARSAYRRRLTDLGEDLEEATANNDPERAARIQEEIDALVDQLTTASGLGGRDRGAVTDAERARVAVRRAVKSALDRIAEAHPDLGAHLHATIRTGTFCAYVPDPASPVRWRVGDGASAGAAAAPAAGATTRRTLPRPLVVGRGPEQLALRAAWEAGGVVVLAGEPGIGKTTLVADLAATVDVALCGRCDDHLGVSYQPVVEILRGLVDLDGAAVAADAGPGALAPLVPELAAAPAGEVDRLALFDAVTRVLRAAARRRRLLVAVDDLHWAPQPTLSLLVHLVRELAGEPVLFALTYRDTEVGDELRSFLAALGRLGDVLRLELRGLDASAVVDLGADDDDAKRLVEHTGGNPLFVRALLGTSLDDELPTSVLDVVADRVARVSAPARRLATVLAVAGERVDARVATSLGTIDDVDELLLAGLVVEDGRSVAFPHALVRRAVERSVSGVRRASLHREVAEALEAVGAPAAELAFHFVEAASIGEPAPAVRYSIAATEAALRAVAFEEAIVHADRGLRIVPDGTVDHCMLLLLLGEARHSAGDLASARVALDEAGAIARSLKDAALLADVAYERGYRGAQVGHHEPDVARSLEEALAWLGDADPRRRARLLARLSIEESGGGRVDEARHLASTAVDLARTIDDPRILLIALEAEHHVHDAPEHLDLRLTIADEIDAVARASGDLEFQFSAASIRAIDACERGDIDAFDRHLDEVHRLALLRPTLHSQWFELEQRVVRAVIAGDLDAAEQLAERELAVGTEGAVANAFRGYALQLLVIRDEQGRSGELAEIATSMASDAGWRPGETTMAALAQLCAGATDEARSMFEGIDLTTLPRDTLLLGILATAARLTLAFGDIERAAVVDAALRPFAGRNCSIALGTIAIGPVDRYLSYTARVLGDNERARQHLIDAIAMDQRMQADRWIERDRADLDSLLRETTWDTSSKRSSTA